MMMIIMNCALLVALFSILIVVDCAATDLKVKLPSDTAVDPNGHLKSDNTSASSEKTDELRSRTDSNGVDGVEMGKDQLGGLKEGVKKDNLESGNSSEEKGTQGGRKDRKGKDGSVNSEGVKNESSNEGSVSKEVPNKGTSVSAKKEIPLGEECDSANRCTDDKNALVACLRVPGNESPDLSLLIQNKGTGPLSVVISAPALVQIEITKFPLQEKENKKVKVSIRNGGADNSIVLTAGNGNCSLDFKDLIMHESGKGTDNTSQSTNVVAIVPILSALGFVAAVVVALVLVYFRFRQRQRFKYQKLDMELPVSGGPKIESDENDAWDNSWGDNWDDEEAPKTPSMPLTPSLSSKGLAPRRLIKDGWKD